MAQDRQHALGQVGKIRHLGPIGAFGQVARVAQPDERHACGQQLRRQFGADASGLAAGDDDRAHRLRPADHGIGALFGQIGISGLRDLAVVKLIAHGRALGQRIGISLGRGAIGIGGRGGHRTAVQPAQQGRGAVAQHHHLGGVAAIDDGGLVFIQTGQQHPDIARDPTLAGGLLAHLCVGQILGGGVQIAAAAGLCGDALRLGQGGIGDGQKKEDIPGKLNVCDIDVLLTIGAGDIDSLVQPIEDKLKKDREK